MPVAAIRLFGQFDLSLGDESPRLDSARVESLIAYLSLHSSGPQDRRRVASALWPDSTEAQARTNLRHVLHTLRLRLPDADEHLVVTSRSVAWRSRAWVDVSEFERLLAGDDRERSLRAAVELYAGDLLEGCSDEWLAEDRDRLRRRYLDALAELAELCPPAEAIGYAERLVRADPLREDAYRLLMSLHVARDDLAGALRIYHVCCSTLERELGVEPSAATRVLYAGLLPRSETMRVGGPPLVGRDAEQRQLTAWWRDADSGVVRFVLVSGESGVGKSRLVEEFRARFARRGVATAEARCYPVEGALAYGPVAAWLRSPALRPRLERLDRVRLTELARLLPELLTEVPGLEPPRPLPENDQRHRLFDAVAAVVLSGPTLLVVDDLQHGDRETCRLLHYLLRLGGRLLLVATARREEIDGALAELLTATRADDRVAELELGRLSRDDTVLLAERLTGAKLGPADARLLHAETEGNSLFVVEAVRSGWTGGHELSPRVQAVIEARLAELSVDTRAVVEVAAAIGREFSADVLTEAAGMGADTVVRGLDELWRRRIVQDRGGGGAYDFTHGKIREVAYHAVSPPRRRELHRRIADALERLNTAAPGAVAARIAGHLARAGAVDRAVTWFRRAAEAAQLLHAHAQAIRLLEHALELVATVPASAERDAVELAVRTELLGPLVSMEGYAAPSTCAVQRRAEELSHGAELSPPLVRSLALTALTLGDFAKAFWCGERLSAASAGDDVLVVEAAYVLGIAAFWQADFGSARTHFERAVEHYRPANRTTHLIRFGQDPKVICQGRLANTLWFLGFPEEAREARRAALAWADEIEHPYSRGAALVFATLLALDMGDEQTLRRYSAELAAIDNIARQNSLMAVVFKSYVDILDGGTGVDRIRREIELTRDEPAAPGTLTVLNRVLLAACEAAGDKAGALEVADRLLRQDGPARIWAPEAERVRSRLG